jgi:hypothetical protein
MTAVERIAARAVARVRARLIAALPVEELPVGERDGDLVLRGRRSAWRWIAGALR